MSAPSATAYAFRPTEGASYKLIYLARRHPSLAVEDFAAAWRAHSALASTFATSLGSHFRSVRQCVRDHVDDLPEPFTRAYDGSSILAMRSWADLMAARYHPHAIDELAKDEARVFAGAVDDWTMAVEEEVLRDGATDSHVILSFLTPREPSDPTTFAQQSRAALKALAATDTSASRMVWNRVVDPARAYPFTAVAERWYPGFDAIIAAIRKTETVDIFAQARAADPTRSVHLVARLNLAKAATGGDGTTQWTEGD